MNLAALTLTVTTLLASEMSERLLRTAQDQVDQAEYEQEIENAYMEEKMHDGSIPAFLTGLAFGSCVSCSSRFAQACSKCALVRDPVACCFVMTGSFGCVTILSMFAGIFQTQDDDGNLLGEANYIFAPFTVGFGIGMSCGFIASKGCARIIKICGAHRHRDVTETTVYGSLGNISYV